PRVDGDDRNRARVADDLALVIAPLLDVDADQTAFEDAPRAVRPHTSPLASLPAANADSKNHGSSSGPRPMCSSGSPAHASRQPRVSTPAGRPGERRGGVDALELAAEAGAGRDGGGDQPPCAERAERVRETERKRSAGVLNVSDPKPCQRGAGRRQLAVQRAADDGEAGEG